MIPAAITLGAWFATQVAAPQVTPRAPEVFAAHVESVVIDAFVTDRDRAVPGLVKEDFILKDNGVTQPFDLIPADSIPIRAVLVFDTSSSMKGAKLDSLRGAAWSFVEKLRPEDEVALVTFSDEIAWLAPLSPDHAQTRLALLKLRAAGGTSAHDALFTALLMPSSSYRTLVILFSDGEDNTSWLGEKALRAFVERSNALIHVVAARSVDFVQGFAGRHRPPDSTHVKTMRALAEVTGGSLIEVNAPERIEAAFTQILEAMKSRYVLRYTPDTDPTPGWHTLDLKLRTRKGRVRGRAGYWAEKP